MAAVDQIRPSDTDDKGTKAEWLSAPKILRTKLSVFSWSSFFFAVLQSVCSAFIALNGIRFLVGAGAFAAAAGALHVADRLHGDAVRIPMTLFALAGALLNLIALWRVWRLRRRPASAWRLKPLTPERKRSERLQLGLSVLTLALLAVEFFAHRATFHHY